MNMFTNPIRLGCRHMLCKKCWKAIRETNKVECPLCRRPDTTNGTPCTEIEVIVQNTGRMRVCGNSVTDVNLSAHERECKACWQECMDLKMKTMMTTVLKTKAKMLVLERRNKRKNDECEELKRSNQDLRRKLSHNEEREQRRKRRLVLQNTII